MENCLNIKLEDAYNTRDQVFETILVFMQNNFPDVEGVIYFQDLTGVGLNYNLKTAEIKSISDEEKNGVTAHYDLKIFEHVIEPLNDAIALLSKLDLLKKLEKEYGKKLAIKISSAYLLNHQVSGLELKRNIEKVFLDLLRPSLIGFFRISRRSEIEKTIKKVLEKHGINKINSLLDAEKIFKEIEDHCEGLEKNNKRNFDFT